MSGPEGSDDGSGRGKGKMTNRRGYRGLAALLALLLTLCCAPGALADADGPAQTGTAEALPLVLTVPAAPEGAVRADADAVTDIAQRLTDGNANTRIACALGETIRAQWPDAAQEAAALYLEWHAAPLDGYTLVQYGASGQELSRELVNDGLLERVFTLAQGCAAVELLVADGAVPAEETERETQQRLADDRMALSGLTVYGAGALPEDVRQWSVSEGEPDVLLVAARPGEEFTAFGGLLPLLLGRGADVRVLFMTETTAQARSESFAALYALGLRAQPIVAGFTGRGGTDYDMLRGKKEWGAGEAPSRVLEDTIGALRPAVVVTYSSDRAQENGMHRLTGEAVEDALAALAGGEETSWQPQKFYMLATAQQTAEAAQATVPDTAAPLVAYGGQSADALAQRALDTGYASQAVLRPQAAAGCAYRLVTSAVGADTGADLLEHIDVPPAPTATPEPTPEATTAVKLLESVPLDAETQAAILELCGGDRDTFCAIMAIAWVESRFDTDAVGDNGVSIGMMQVNTRWHTGRMEALGVTDLTDPVQCAAVALDYLRELSEGYGFGWITDHDLYMAYNMGPGNARIAIDSGTASSGYSRAALTAYGDYAQEMEAAQA